MDLTHKDENTESTEERTIMMDSIKALHTGRRISGISCGKKRTQQENQSEKPPQKNVFTYSHRRSAVSFHHIDFCVSRYIHCKVGA